MSKNYDKAINDLLREFLKIFGEKKGVSESLLHSIRKHLIETPAPNPTAFVASINFAVSGFLNTSHICEAVESMGIAEAKSVVHRLPPPLQKIVQEAIFLTECRRIHEMAISVFRSE